MVENYFLGCQETPPARLLHAPFLVGHIVPLVPVDKSVENTSC